MNKLQAYLQQRKNQKGYLFVPYLALGDPDFGLTFDIASVLLELGADSIELGLPFTDPTADGPVLQRAFRRSLAGGFSLDQAFAFFERLHQAWPEHQFLAMGYANMFYQGGFASMFKKLAALNITGVVIPDIPLEEKLRLYKNEKLDSWREQMAWINFITPTTTEERLQQAVADASGFLYLVAGKGVTGGRASFDIKPLLPLVQKVKKQSDVPVLVGFGVREREHVQQVLKYTDGFIIGSRIHQIIEENLQQKKNIPAKIRQELQNILPAR